MNFEQIDNELAGLKKEVEETKVESEQDFQQAKNVSQIISKFHAEFRHWADEIDSYNKLLCAKMDAFMKKPKAKAKPKLSLDAFDEGPIDPSDEMAAEIKKSTLF